MISSDRTMISSSSHLLLKIQEGPPIRQRPSLERNQVLALKQEEYKKRSEIMRRICLRRIFYRLSWTSKLNLLTSLAECFNTNNGIFLLLNTLQTVWGKMACYMEATTDTELVYDMNLNDHNRSLDKDFLSKVLSQELTWFKNLEEPDQISLFLNMVRSAGGSIVRKLYVNLRKIYRNKLMEESSKVENQEEILDDSSYIVFSKSGQLSLLKDLQKDKRGSKHDPHSSDTAEVQKQSKIWDETIRKYKKEIGIVEKKPQKTPRVQSARSKTSGKTKKTGATKKTKGSKSGKSSKKSKTSKGSKKGKRDTSIDWIQLLPIWIIKKIFDYLDSKTLKKARKVNSFWNYVIGDLIQDRKTRKFLQGKVQQIEEKLGPSVAKIPLPAKEKPPFFENMSTNLKQMDKKVKRMIRRGAVNPKLVKPIEGATENMDFILKDAYNEDPDAYLVPLQAVTVFPRYKKECPPLYQPHPFHYKDVGIIEEITTFESVKSLNVTSYDDSCSSSTRSSGETLN